MGIAVTTARIRPVDQSVGVACADGGALRVTRSRAWLEKLGHAGIAPIRRLAIALSARLGWPQPTPSWPFSKLPEPGQLLAADKEITQAVVARRLRSAWLHWLDDSVARRGRGEDLLQEAMESKADDALPDTCTSPPDAVLVLTPARLADLLQQPGRFTRQLEDLVRESPEAGVLLVEKEGTITVPGRVAMLLRRLRIEATDLSAHGADASPERDDHPSVAPGMLEQADPGKDDPEAKGTVIAALGQESPVMPKEDQEEPDENGFGPR